MVAADAEAVLGLEAVAASSCVRTSSLLMRDDVGRIGPMTVPVSEPNGGPNVPGDDSGYPGRFPTKRGGTAVGIGRGAAGLGGGGITPTPTRLCVPTCDLRCPSFSAFMRRPPLFLLPSAVSLWKAATASCVISLPVGTMVGGGGGMTSD